MFEGEKQSKYTKKSVEWPRRWLLFEKLGLNPWNKTASMCNFYPYWLAPNNLKVVQNVTLHVKVAESGHSVEATETTA